MAFKKTGSGDADGHLYFVRDDQRTATPAQRPVTAEPTRTAGDGHRDVKPENVSRCNVCGKTACDHVS